MNELTFSGLKTKTGKTLKVLVQLYSSFSSEFVSVLLELLLKAMRSSDLMCSENSQKSRSTVLDGWKLVIAKISNKEPELLLELLEAVLEKIETREGLEYGMTKYQLRLYILALFYFLSLIMRHILS